MADKLLTVGRIKRQKAQGTLEISFVFIIMVLLIGAIMHIWIWSNNQIVNRQTSYNAGRVSAGTPSDTYVLRDHWPIYPPQNLTEEDVLITAPSLNRD